jgi:uncharacterized protein YxeA
VQLSGFFPVFNINKLTAPKMKNIRSLIFVIPILAISCTVGGQVRKSVQGNHHVTKSERTTDAFTGVKASSGIDVYLSQGDREAVTVEADENLHEYILTEVKGGILHVYTDANIRNAERERVYVTIRDVKSVSTSSAGDIVGETPIRADDLSLSASSAGDIKLEIYARNIDINISSSGDMTLKGETETLDADLSSAGDLNAYELTAKEADVSVSSAGDAEIYVTEKLKARASSAGDINYKGNPTNIDVHTSSAGGIHGR